MKIERTEEEKRSYIVDHVDKSIFVEAGAGAGKTSLIVKRITNQIRQGCLKPEELVVITFTNKAAEELFERIQKEFESEEKNSANTEEQRANFTNAIEHLEQMHISTIHSFCFSLLKERCFDAKLPLGVELLENEKTISRKKDFFENWYAQLAKTDIEAIKNTLELYTGYGYGHKEKLERFFMTICEKPQDVNVVSLTDMEFLQLEQELLKCASDVDSLLKQINAELLVIAQMGIKFYEDVTKQKFFENMVAIAFDTFYKCLKDGFPREKRSTFNDKVKLLYGTDEIKLAKIAKKYADFDHEEVNKRFNEFLNLSIRPNNLYKKWEDAERRKKECEMSYAYFMVMKYAMKARDAYISQLGAEQLSNDQLIQKAKELVFDSKEACTYFRKKYKCIYVDEFQDTDHIQADLIWKLACDERDVLKPGTLFIVGDPKQAIYRFRGGEPAVYNQVKEKMETDALAEVYELDNNYRSNAEVIDWVNTQFKNKINKSGITYRDMIHGAKATKEVPAKPGEEELVLKGVYWMSTLAGYNEANPISEVDYEAARLALFIQNLISKNYQIYEIKETDNGKERVLRRVRYDDFLILCRNKTEMDGYVEELKKASIPVDLAGNAHINTCMELRRFLVLYRFLLYPYDRKSMHGATEILRNNTNARLELMRRETKGMNQYAKAQYLLKHMEYLFSWDEEIGQEDIYAIQARAHQMVENVFGLAKEEPEHILTALENYIEKILERELLLDENQNAVRFMNVHKAKGLEGVITIITNRNEKEKTEVIPDYTASTPNANGMYDFYTGYKNGWNKLHGYDYNAQSKAAYKKAKTDDEAEEIRLEYVAATRAKEVLIVTDEIGTSAFLSGYSIPLEHDLTKVLDEDENEEMTEEVSEQKEPSHVETAGKTILSMPTADMKQASYISISPSNLEIRIKTESSDSDNPEKENVIDMDKVEEQNEIEAQTGKALTKEEIKKLPRRPKGNVFGTTMHRAFELLIQKEGDVTTCVCQAIIENAEDLLLEGKQRYLEEGEAEELYLTAVKEFLEAALKRFSNDAAMVELLENAKEIHTELPFSYYTSSEENPELFAAIGAHLDKYLKKKKIEKQDGQMYWINGTADLVVVKADGSIHIIDFKSDTKYVDDMEAFEKSIYEKYEGQLILYKYSMSRIFGVDVDKISTELYHLYK